MKRRSKNTAETTKTLPAKALEQVAGGYIIQYKGTTVTRYDDYGNRGG